MDNKQIIEALKIQPLTEEEKTRRHILGRLYGPIATCTESTRNGRKYNRQLWEKALNDEIFKEKVAKKSLFLEFSHPIDREETDPLKACACIPELPRIIDGDLYAYVDILDTPSGKILKTLVDYGFEPGISSRGSGDIMANDEVDPETFFLETWDIVQLPAVRKARLSVCESFDSKKKSLKQALTESLNKASEEDKEIMKETLENLDIKLDEGIALGQAVDPTNPLFRFYPDGIPTLDEIPEATEPTEDENQMLIADAAGDDDDAEEMPALNEAKADEEESEETDAEEAEENEEESEADDKEDEAEEEEADEEETESEEIPAETFMQITNKLFKLLDDITTDENKDAIQDNIAAMLDEIELPEETWEAIGVVVDEDGVNCAQDEDNEDTEATEELPEEENPEVGVVIDASSTDDMVVSEVDNTDEPAVDDGDEEVMESFKELVRQKDLLESEVKALKKAMAVSDAEAATLKEDLDRYKSGFTRTSELAGQATKAKKEVAELTEQLTQKNAQIKALQESVEKARKTTLNESVNKANKQITALTEKLNVVTKQAAAETKALNEQVDQYKAKLAQSAEMTKQYKTKFTAILNKYIESKAQMLGVKSTEITKRLGESYSLKDIDTICESLISSTVNVGRLPFNQKQVKAKINESVAPKSVAAPEEDDLTDLYQLAGIRIK